MWTCQCPKTKRGRNKSTKQWKVIILLLVTLPLSRIVGVMVMEMAIDRSANKESRRALARCIRREMKKAHNKGCYGLILTMLLDWLAIR